MNALTLLALALCVCVTSAQSAQYNRQSSDSELVCFKGFVMDSYCIDLGTLLDMPSVESLRNPDLHSYHCLVDVPRCVEGGYEMLADVRESSGGLYGRFLRLDGNGNQGVVQLARDTGRSGSCSTCTGLLGDETMGFRATVIGTLVPNSGSPQLLATQSVLSYDEPCPGNTTQLEPQKDDLSFQAGVAQTPMLTHGSLMLIGWGFVVPLGVLSARFLRHRPDALWFKMHRILQPFGLIIAIAGWAIALKNFSILGSGIRDTAYAHAVCGSTAMCIGLLQPLNALVRPHPQKDGSEKSKWRLLWEVVHKGLGYVAILLALVTIGLGTKLVGNYKKKFLAGYIAALVMLAVLAFVMIVDRIRYSRCHEEGEGERPAEPDESLSPSEPPQVE